MSGSTLLRRRLVAMTVMALIAGVAYAVYALRIDEIRVSGARTIDPKVVVQRSGLKGGERILWVRLSAVARRLEAIPGIAEARAERSFPGTVVLHVRERAPIARVSGELGVDQDGRLFQSSALSGLPLLEGVRGRVEAGAIVDRSSAAVLEEFAAFPDELRKRTAGISVGPPLSLVLNDRTEVRFGSHLDLAEKAAVALAILKTEAGQELAYIDVRAPGVPVSRRREPPTPAPTSSPAGTVSPTP